jgi:PAS domain S-box-containing protein
MTSEYFITEFNKEAERIYGYTRASVVGKDYLELFVPKENHEYVTSDINKVLAGESTFGYESPIISKDGTKYNLLWNLTSMLNIEGKPVGIIAMGVDITYRSILERAVIDFEEQERQRIGHDLHDDVGQLMTGLGFKTQSLLEKLKTINGSLYREGEEISELVDQAKNKLRHLTKGLLPIDLSDMGLLESIEGLASDIIRLFGTSCELSYAEHFNIKNKDAVIHLYRIVQEATTNALKHAKADKIEIRLDRSDDHVTMIIKDNGVGISDSVLSKGGIGLKIMEYRARLINASLKIYKAADCGTVVKCVMNDR